MTASLLPPAILKETTMKQSTGHSFDLDNAVKQLRTATDHLNFSLDGLSENVKPLLDLLRLQTNIIEVLVQNSSIQNTHQSSNIIRKPIFESEPKPTLTLKPIQRSQFENTRTTMLKKPRPYSFAGGIGNYAIERMGSPTLPVMNRGPHARLPEIRAPFRPVQSQQPQTAEVGVVTPSSAKISRLPSSLKIGGYRHSSVIDISTISGSFSTGPSFESLAHDTKDDFTTTTIAPSNSISVLPEQQPLTISPISISQPARSWTQQDTLATLASPLSAMHIPGLTL